MAKTDHSCSFLLLGERSITSPRSCGLQ